MVLLAHGFYDQSRSCFEVAERYDRRDPRWPYLQTIVSGTAVPETAIPALRRAMARGDQLVPRLRLGEMLFEQGEIDEAERLFQWVLERNPRDARAELGMGRIAHARGRLPEAAEHLKRSIELAPRIRSTHALLTEVYHRLGDEAAAARSRQVMKDLPETRVWPDPFLEEVHNHEVGLFVLVRRATEYKKAEELRASEAVARKAVRLHGDAPRALVALGTALVLENQPDEAAPYLARAVALAPDDPEARYFLGVAQAQQGKFTEAVSSLRKATELQPGNAASYFQLGQCLYKAGNTDDAIEAWRSTLKYDPEHVAATKDLGLLLVSQNRESEARPYLEKARALAPDDEAITEALRRIGPPPSAATSPP